MNWLGFLPFIILDAYFSTTPIWPREDIRFYLHWQPRMDHPILAFRLGFCVMPWIMWKRGFNYNASELILRTVVYEGKYRNKRWTARQPKGDSTKGSQFGMKMGNGKPYKSLLSSWKHSSSFKHNSRRQFYFCLLKSIFSQTFSKMRFFQIMRMSSYTWHIASHLCPCRIFRAKVTRIGRLLRRHLRCRWHRCRWNDVWEKCYDIRIPRAMGLDT